MQYRPSDIDDIDTTRDAVARVHNALVNLWTSTELEPLLERLAGWLAHKLNIHASKDT